MSGKGFLGNMTENLQADCVQSRQAGFIQCFLRSRVKAVLYDMRTGLLFLQKDLPICEKCGIVIRGHLKSPFIEQLAADVREAGENPAQFRYRVGEHHTHATGMFRSGKAYGPRRAEVGIPVCCFGIDPIYENRGNCWCMFILCFA